MAKPKLLVFASGSKDGGGSGVEKLIENEHTGVLNATINGVISNHAFGGVHRIVKKAGKPFFHFQPPFTAERYQDFVTRLKPDFVALSGWLKLTKGLDPRTTINIHPGPLPRFGGKGMHGHHVHEAVMAAYHRGEITHSAVCMHFVTEEFDQGPVFFRCLVKIRPDDTAETLGARVNRVEHQFQSRVTDLVVHGDISWEGKGQVAVTDWYAQQPFCPQELRDL